MSNLECKTVSYWAVGKIFIVVVIVLSIYMWIAAEFRARDEKINLLDKQLTAKVVVLEKDLITKVCMADMQNLKDDVTRLDKNIIKIAAKLRIETK